MVVAKNLRKSADKLASVRAGTPIGPPFYVISTPSISMIKTHLDFILYLLLVDWIGGWMSGWLGYCVVKLG